jgi:Zn-dependent peptidase ImmA (M78 family)
MSSFKAPYISHVEIRERVEVFREQYLSCQEVPVDIETLIEIDLQLNVEPIDNLKQDFDIYALLLSDKKTIIIDKNLYMHDNTTGLRFFLAHELGHLILHNDLWVIFKFDDPYKWIEFYKNVDATQYGYLEGHANEFAGRLLVPYQELLRIVQDSIKKIPDDLKMEIADIVPFLAPSLCKFFEVSDQIMEIRLARENIVEDIE